ncbi:hypothetical protein M1437_00905 [Patescibacteria group bacterium]|nr:hypothetical protein [Patescibacteria group bacterium]
MIRREHDHPYSNLQQVAEALNIPLERLQSASMKDVVGWVKDGREKGWDPQLENSLVWGVAANNALQAVRAKIADPSQSTVYDLELRPVLGRLVQQTIDESPLTLEQGERVAEVILQFSRFVCSRMLKDPSMELSIDTQPQASSFLLNLDYHQPDKDMRS